jgi:glycosyltransferase involved in cell wall biosynthesis
MINSVNGLTIAIDASRNHSGGAKAHLLGILRDCDPRQHGVSVVHVWSYDALLNELPDAPWLVKHSPTQLKQSLLHQLWWQYRTLPSEIFKSGCNILLSTDAGTVCRFTPSVVMSRDMLSFESKEMQRYPLISFARLRLFLLKHMQVRSLRQASGALFLTHYASEVIQRFTGQLNCIRVIPHGIGENFRRQALVGRQGDPDKDIKCLYVSNTDMYKHQWHVVSAIAYLRKAGYPVRLKLVGGGSGPARALLNKAVEQEDPNGCFVDILDSVAHDEIPMYLAKADLFIFASSCENMPNTLVEAMASGLPIACSDRGPMPEILQNAGVYFDPEVPDSIARAIEKLIVNELFRSTVSKKANILAEQYSWSRCAKETFSFLAQVNLIWNERVGSANKCNFE